MRKIYPLIVVLVLTITCQAQDGLYQFTSNYFRADPWQGSFSGFLQRLMNDPGLENKAQTQRTDTTLFYYQADYRQYNPFFFKPERVQVILEQAELPYDDSLARKDTIFLYQLVAYAPDTEGGLRDIKKEFEKIHRKYNRRFFESNYNELKEGETVKGASHNYFVAIALLSPVSVSWGRIESSKQLVLVLTLRIKSKENRAVLPAPFYNPE